MRFAMMDIEATGLEASYGRLLCCCFKFTDEDKVRTARARFCRNEPAALKEITRLFDEADVIVGWNSKLYDVPYINARLMQHNLPPLKHQKMHLDIMYQARKMRLRGSRMDYVSKDLKTKVVKHDVPAWQWVLAAEGNQKAGDEIAYHCHQDVLLTEELFHRLKPFIIRITK